MCGLWKYKTVSRMKKRLEERRSSVEKDLTDNEYDTANVAIRKYEIMKLTERINQFN